MKKFSLTIFVIGAIMTIMRMVPTISSFFLSDVTRYSGTIDGLNISHFDLLSFLQDQSFFNNISLCGIILLIIGLFLLIIGRRNNK